mmetsp:Transcript_30755/g.27956  ORF Transcript_30755/g.27956 Transcript_30755/m.27956 type:complete len:222 (+) Transcript_30755:33-698(+)
MQWNSFLFPAPENCFEYRKEDNIVYIPKKKESKSKKSSKSSKEESKDSNNEANFDYIPCLYLPYKEGSNRVLMFFHGNAEDIGWSLSFVRTLQKRLKVHILSVEYPGYSLYIGKPNANTILEDSEYVFNFITDEIGILPQDVILFGRSIGSGPATHLAARHKVNMLVLMSAYTSIKRVVKDMAGSIAAGLVAERFKNIDEISKVKSPVLIIHGIADKLISY